MTENEKLKIMQILNPQVIENLGQINLLLSDKTGTLTVGKMKLKNIWM
jgi:P-type E1-E2 ATPase